VALNVLLGTERLSRDIDLFHDTESAVAATWRRDRQLLDEAGFSVRILREARGLVEAEVVAPSGDDSVRMEWARDSAFRFFPLIEHPDLGLALHPFDLATNKVLALVSRLEARDWIDVIESDRRLQPLGYLAWAACGKDPGFGPGSILEHAARTGRYSALEISEIGFSGPPPDAAELSLRWRDILHTARLTVEALPPSQVGSCVLNQSLELCRLPADTLRQAVEGGKLRFHAGSIRGALPRPLPPG
jgi:hypothetical protein